MKVILALFACIAVSQAAFTSNLLQRAQPALSQALFKVRLASGRSEIQTPLVQQLQEHANDLLNQINNAVATGQEIAGNVVQQLQDTWAQLHGLGSNVVDAGSSILSELWNGLFGGLFGKGKSIGAVVDFVQNFNVQDLINGLLAHAQNLVSQLNLPQMLQNAAAALFNQLTGRGFFSDIWNQITEVGSAAWENIQNIFSNVTTVAGDAFANVQAIASEFVADAASNIHGITSQAATDFLNYLKPYAQDLGNLYDQVAAAVSQIGQK